MFRDRDYETEMKLIGKVRRAKENLEVNLSTVRLPNGKVIEFS